MEVSAPRINSDLRRRFLFMMVCVVSICFSISLQGWSKEMVAASPSSRPQPCPSIIKVSERWPKGFFNYVSLSLMDNSFSCRRQKQQGQGQGATPHHRTSTEVFRLVTAQCVSGSLELFSWAGGIKEEHTSIINGVCLFL